MPGPPHIIILFFGGAVFAYVSFFLDGYAPAEVAGKRRPSSVIASPGLVAIAASSAVIGFNSFMDLTEMRL